MLNFILSLLAQPKVEIILVGERQIWAEFSLSQAIGHPENQVLLLKWYIVGTPYTTIFNEEGLNSGAYCRETKRFTFEDIEGDPFEMRILVDGAQVGMPDELLPADPTSSVFLLVQEGGSSSELYLHSHLTQESALADKKACWEKGAYRTSDVVEVPASLANHPRFFEVAKKLVKASQNLSAGVSE